jgi:hypothetical protein
MSGGLPPKVILKVYLSRFTSMPSLDMRCKRREFLTDVLVIFVPQKTQKRACLDDVDSTLVYNFVVVEACS